MHRRSRTGCFTCRLRRKKCDEGKPGCKACRHLGLKCEYKRPMWWSNNEQRRQQKEMIKNIIKRTKLTEKASHPALLNPNSPPSLCHSAMGADQFSDSMGRREGSIDSQFSVDFGFNPCMPQDMMFVPGMPIDASFPQYPHFPPYEVDIKTETQLFINDMPTRKDSTISTFSAFQTPPTGPFGADAFLQHESSIEHRQEFYTEEPIDFQYFDFNHYPVSPKHQSIIQVDECDQHLLDNFIQNVVRLLFPVMEVNQHGSPTEAILLALESNKAYLHSCLSISALHFKSTQGVRGEQIDHDIQRHRGLALMELCEQMKMGSNNSQNLEATLSMIFLQCSVARPEDCLPDIPWHKHLDCAIQFVHSLNMPEQLVNNSQPHPPFNMTVTAWIDILGASMLGRKPLLADTYREKHVANSTAGLAELMGCEDRIMFIISEIACLEAFKLEGSCMDDIQLCGFIQVLGDKITMYESEADPIANAYNTHGALSAKQLSTNTTAAFRIAARLYLCSLVPNYDRQAPNITNLVNNFADAMEYIPMGEHGFDRSLVWPLLIAGSACLPTSTLRQTYANRIAAMGDAAECGSIANVRELLKETWRVNDDALARGDAQNVHWRDVMRTQGWDFLLL
ncbi:hypothetical protein EG327_000217 [Venturia inaequalis]|uniref:Zn(2)-C6 fungal-type domain-containing protein n=1 Tax=Venturia inaequalis TaxID=5025 RepID=A0A8H3ZFE6_VENIN|nr:hypothetical protein EG327_000217 [Venturia inaequalis]